jgi:hypothetical protein
MTDDKPGPTGQFPHGALNEQDRGELRVAVSVEKDMIRIDFGTPVKWVSLPPDTALTFASVLVKRALALKGATRDRG